MKISESDIKKICSEGIYKSGSDYFREGRVHIRVRDKNNIVASVDSDKLYNVHIGFDDSGKISETFCTCPYFQTMGANCKHIIATLKTRKQELDAGEGFLGNNERAAQKLCREFEIIHEHKNQLRAGFIFRINTSNGTKCSYSMSITLGDSDTQIAGIESFLSAFISGDEYKLSKHKSFKNEHFTFGAYEEHILTILAEAFQNKSASASVYTPKLTATDFGSFTAMRIIPLLKGVDCKFIIDGMPFPNLMIKEEDPDILVDITATDDSINLSVPQNGTALVPDGSWFLYDGDIYATTSEWRGWFMPLYNSTVTQNRTQIDFTGRNSVEFAANVLPYLRGKRGVITQGLENAVVDDKPRFDIYFDRFEDGISAALTASYGKISIRLPDLGEEFDKIIVRDYADERYILSFFEHFYTSGQMLYLDNSDELYAFLTQSIKKLSQLAQIHTSDAFNQMLISPPEIKSTAHYNPKIDLLEVGFESELSPADIIGILHAIRHKKKYYRISGGSFLDLNDDLYGFDILSSLDFSYADVKSGKKALARYNTLFLSGLLKDGKISSDSEFEELTRKIQDIRADIPDYLDSVLRDYQKIGVNWLKQLSELGLGGILADDMGLGKTLEVIAFVMSEVRQKPTLVVTPSSLTYNWLHEIKKFAPTARAKIIDGAKEERTSSLSDISGYDFIITSYPLLRRDIAEYQEIDFEYCFIDEAQHIKNPKTLSAKSVKKIRAGKYFALSGTPIENSLSELWSIFDFIMPGYLLTYQQFASIYEKPIMQNEDELARNALRSKIKPFILRRMKYEVLSELPDKIENTFFAELDTSQKKLYTAYLAAARKEATELLEFGDNMRILSLLMRLRQICCHPRLIDASYEKDSGKLQLLEDLVTGGIAAGHRILIFSQFTQMLSIIRDRLNSLNISSFYLDGKTPAPIRTEIAEKFNSGDRSVFLVSLKAGGTGLNLIGADMVIHYDPWWNPAAQNQASDRAYRIGQTRAVHVIRLAAKGTIEEQILKLQDKKRLLADDMIRTNSSTLSNLTKEEILDLFK